MSHSGQLRLWRYYAIEGLSSFACTVFQQGLYFWAASRHGYGTTACLLLGAVQGLGYMLSASVGGKLAGRLGYDRMLQITMIGIALLTCTLWRWSWVGTPFLLMALFISLTGPFWPSTEANIMHADSPIRAPRRLGLYNITWSLTAALGFFSCGFLVSHHVDAIVWLPGVVMGAQLLFFLQRARPSGVAYEPSVAPDENADLDLATRRRFMHLHWLSNSLAYFVLNGFSALLPSLAAGMGLSQAGVIWLTCSYLFSRAAAFVLFMLWEGWHYRARWSIAGLWLSPLCVGVMLFAKTPSLVLAACVLLGLALGLAYSGSLYYSMNYGQNKGEHGGLHEAILGSGILFGPLVGAGGAALGGSLGASLAIVITAVVLSGLGWWLVFRFNPPSRRA